MKYKKRERLLVDAKVQGSMLICVARYWLACVATIELLSLSWLIATGPTQASFFGYLFNHDWRPSCIRVGAGALLLVPIVFDLLRMSNRFAGPVYRMQRALHKVIDSGTVEEVRLREHDYWHDFAADLNLALAKLAAQGRSNPPSAKERPLEEPVAL